jgi:hypothetical protein
MFDVGDRRLDFGCRRLDVGYQMLDIGCWISDVGGCRLNVETWNLKPEISEFGISNGRSGLENHELSKKKGTEAPFFNPTV